MMKSIALLPRMPGTTRAAFQDYYEKNHAPLAIEHFPFTKYVRNHLTLGTDSDIGFDTIGEFWCADMAKIAALMAGEVGTLMRADERKFMDPPRLRAGSAAEYLVHGAPRALDQGLKKTALLIVREASLDRASFEDVVMRWAARLEAKRVTVDFVTPWDGPAWPCEAIVWLWQGLGEAPALPPGVSVWQSVAVIAHETSPDTR